MNKNELKKVLKPLIKECIKEVLVEQGVASMITEATQLNEAPRKQVQQQVQKNNAAQLQRLKEKKQKMLDAIGKDAYNGIDLFEGTTPTKAPSEPSHGPLAGTDPQDPGVDISGFGGLGVWKKLAGN